MGIKWLAFILSMSIFFLVIELVRRERLTFKYAAGWLIASALAVFFSVFHKCLFAIAQFCGFALPSNFIFFALLCTFVVLGPKSIHDLLDPIIVRDAIRVGK